MLSLRFPLVSLSHDWAQEEENRESRRLFRSVEIRGILEPQGSPRVFLLLIVVKFSSPEKNWIPAKSSSILNKGSERWGECLVTAERGPAGTIDGSSSSPSLGWISKKNAIAWRTWPPLLSPHVALEDQPPLSLTSHATLPWESPSLIGVPNRLAKLAFGHST